ncbi:hypothetical protein ACFFX0_13545 [Citricoccus parietis]|uniref:Uncharacterized protein n=1 Tax=Citricoccus parietis TaxID=592307 RepID=A0ABV5FZQ4_9MICC
MLRWCSWGLLEGQVQQRGRGRCRPGGRVGPGAAVRGAGHATPARPADWAR